VMIHAGRMSHESAVRVIALAVRERSPRPG